MGQFETCEAMPDRNGDSSPSHPVILSNAKDLGLLRVNSAKSLRTSSVKDLWETDPLLDFTTGRMTRAAENPYPFPAGW